MTIAEMIGTVICRVDSIVDKERKIAKLRADLTNAKSKRQARPIRRKLRKIDR